jgi:mannose/fructose/N-acetylgalactosamine-specific phosphotransferase system component IIC
LGEILALALLGGLLALDGTSLGQFMISRPLVASTLAGWMVGEPGVGFVVGSLLEIYLLVSFPTGGSRFPEGGPAAVVAAAVAGWGDSPGAVAIGVALGLIWGQLGGLSVTLLRTVNTRLAPDPTRGHVTPAAVVAGHLSALGLDFLRGFLVTLVGLIVGLAVVRLAPLWPLGDADTRGLLLVGGAVSLGVLLRSYGGLSRRGVLFACGAIAGAAVGALL